MAPSTSRFAMAVSGTAAVAASSAFLAAPAGQPREVSAPQLQKQLRTSGSTPSGSSSLPLTSIGLAFGATAAAASARRSQGRTARTEICAFENELGVQAPIGFWDPAGFTSEGDQKEFYRRRCVEIKHGRVAMLATIGYIVPEFGARFPGYLSPSTNLKFCDMPHGLAAVTKVPGTGWFQVTVFCGLCEIFLAHQVPESPAGKLCTRFFGGSNTNYEYGFLGIPGYLGGKAIADPEVKRKKLSSELANGRLAMMAIIGMFFQDGLTGTPWGDWANFTDSPLRAFENELGVQAPAGFWDPAGFSASGDAAAFRRRRAVELKHGRVAMIACIGYITPEYYRWDAFLSPSLNLKFSDVPNGLAAFGKVPGSGWAQMIAFAGTVELFQYTDDPTRPPGDFANAGSLGIPNGFLKISDPAAKAKKLSSEIANGRLAMMAIIGMFFQDGLTGSAWGDWANYTDSPLRAGPTPAAWGADAPNRPMIPLNDLPSVAGSYEPFIPYMTPWNSEKAPELRPQDCIAGTGGPFANNYWDPAGLSKNKTRDEILQFRAQELKHGRVAMLAVLGWFHVAASWHPVGDFALGERVSDNPLTAATQMSFGAHLQVIFTILCLEWLTTFVCKPPQEKPWDVIGWTDIIADEEYPPWKLAQVQELNNGRLAMVAFIGLVVGDLMFGDYGAGIAKPCFGAPVCQDLLQFFPEKNFDVYPASPFKMPPLYPRA